MGKVNFCRLTKAQYETLASPDTDTIYFLTDSKILLLSGQEYIHREKADRFLVNRVFAHDTYGTVAYLDADNRMDLSGYFAEGISSIDLWLVSASNVTGNIVLTVGNDRFTVPVTSAVTKQTLSLSNNAVGKISIVRDTADSADTLNDGTDAVTALVVDWRCS